MRQISTVICAVIVAVIVIQPAVAVGPRVADFPSSSGFVSEFHTSDSLTTEVIEKRLSSFSLQSEPSQPAAAKRWERRGPQSPVLARVLYLVGLAGLSWTTYHGGLHLDVMDTQLATVLASVGALSGAAIYVSVRIELDSNSDDS